MREGTTYVGMNVHQERVVVAMLAESGNGVEEIQVGGDERGVKKLVRELERRREAGGVECAYETGQCGYALQRQLEAPVGLLAGTAASIVTEVPKRSLLPASPAGNFCCDHSAATRWKT